MRLKPTPAPAQHAAMKLLETQTASALSLCEVARQAGVSHNAPDHHVGDRQGLLRRVVKRAVPEALAARLQPLLSRHDADRLQP